MLRPKYQSIESTVIDLDEGEVFMEILEDLISFEAFVAENIDMRGLIFAECTGNKPSDEIIRN